MNKYRFYVHNNKVIAVSSYAGRTVRGVAKCSPEDTFDLEAGKRLAAARCNLKVAEKRYTRANKKAEAAATAMELAKIELGRMDDYLYDAGEALVSAQDHLANLLHQF